MVRISSGWVKFEWIFRFACAGSRTLNFKNILIPFFLRVQFLCESIFFCEITFWCEYRKYTPKNIFKNLNQINLGKLLQ
jgi:hypothetical protein